MKCRAGWSTSWSQNFWEKYQQSQICRWYHLNGRKQRGTKKPLDEGEGESEKVGLKLNIPKPKIMASSPITSWQIDGGTMETVTDFILLGSKIPIDGDCSHEIKRRLLLGRKAMTNLDGVWKSRDITLPTKVHLIKARVFPVVIYGYESWIIMKVKCWRIDAFELWCWRRHLRVPWTARNQISQSLRKSNQSIPKEINSAHSLEGLTLQLESNSLATWCNEPTFWKRLRCWDRLRVGREVGNGAWDGWMVSPTQWIWVEQTLGDVKNREVWCAAVHGVTELHVT